MKKEFLSSIILVLVFILILASCRTMPVLFNQQTNSIDTCGLRQGMWKTYWDDAGSIPMSKAWFKDDKEYMSKEYHCNGRMRLKMKWYDERIKVKYYDTLRVLEQKGWARYESSSKEIHYYWHGKWKYFENKRKQARTTQYRNGEEVIFNQ